MAERAPVVLFLDDLQWGDADSAALLLELLRPPEPPPLLLIGCFRSRGGLRQPLSQGPPHTPFCRPAGARDSRAQSRGSTGRRGRGAGAGASRGTSAAQAPSPPRRSLASRWATPSSSTSSRGTCERTRNSSRCRAMVWREEPVRLDEVIWARVSQLPEDARTAISRQSQLPASRSIATTARRAAALAEDDQPALALLRVGRMVRSSGEGAEDRSRDLPRPIRQTVVSRLSPKAKTLIHQRLAFALETSSSIPDPESLAIHYEGAGRKSGRRSTRPTRPRRRPRRLRSTGRHASTSSRSSSERPMRPYVSAFAPGSATRWSMPAAVPKERRPISRRPRPPTEPTRSSSSGAPLSSCY